MLGGFSGSILKSSFFCEFELGHDILENLGRLPDTLDASYLILYEKIEGLKGSVLGLVKKALMWIMGVEFRTLLNGRLHGNSTLPPHLE
jgi:hypothetical protein